MENKKRTLRTLPTVNQKNSNQASMPHTDNTSKTLTTQHQSDVQTSNQKNSNQAPMPHTDNASTTLITEHQLDVQTSNQVNRPHDTNETDAEIMLIHLNDMQTSTYDAKIGNTNATMLFDSSATLSCISEQFYAKI